MSTQDKLQTSGERSPKLSEQQVVDDLAEAMVETAVQMIARTDTVGTGIILKVVGNPDRMEEVRTKIIDKLTQLMTNQILEKLEQGQSEPTEPKF